MDGLLCRKEFADLWVMKWAELLEIRSRENVVYPKGALLYFEWLRDQMLTNAPLDRIVQSLLTASGSTFRNPAATYYQIEPDTLKMAENTAQVFMGMRIQCAQCHNHPFDRWTLNDYYSFAAFFAQVGRKPGDDPRETVIFDRHDGEVKHPVTHAAMRPKFLGGETPDIKGESRREALARWLTSPQNPYFARNVANILWAHFMGRGIIEPVDDVRISNPALQPRAARRAGGPAHRLPLRFQEPRPRHLRLAHLPAQHARQRHQRAGRPQFQQSPHPPPPRRGAAGLHQPGHRHAGQVPRPAARRPRGGNRRRQQRRPIS